MFTPEQAPVPFDTLYDCRVPPMENVGFTVCCIANDIDRLLLGEAPSIDRMGAKVFKMAGDIFVKLLCLLFQRSLQHSKQPLEWEFSRVTPILKNRRQKRPYELQAHINTQCNLHTIGGHSLLEHH